MTNVDLNEKIRVWVTSDKDRTFSTGSKTLVLILKKRNLLN